MKPTNDETALGTIGRICGHKSAAKSLYRDACTQVGDARKMFQELAIQRGLLADREVENLGDVLPCGHPLLQRAAYHRTFVWQWVNLFNRMKR